MKYEFSDDDIIRLKDDADYTVIFDSYGISYKTSVKKEDRYYNERRITVYWA